MDEHRHYEALDEAECRRLLEFGDVGRIALSVGALPAILPITYTLNGDAVVFRPATTQVAANAINNVVAFQTDYRDLIRKTYWSVMAIGVVERVTDLPNEAVPGLYKGPRSFAGDDLLYRLPLQFLSGTRIANGP